MVVCLKGEGRVCVISSSLFPVHRHLVLSEIMVPELLFAVSTELLAESADDMRRSLQCLQG